jgi:FKBP-type peptidyl-prolyl cis-trans isomerase FkpA
MRRFRLLLVAATLSLTGCLNKLLDVPLPPDDPSNPATETFDASTGVDISKMSKTEHGVYYFDTTVGSGAQLTNKRIVSLLYIGYLKNGAIFDRANATTPRGLDLNVTLGGFSEGMLGMRIGGQRKMVIPSALAFGNSQQPGVPPNSTLIFDVQLIDIP